MRSRLIKALDSSFYVKLMQLEVGLLVELTITTKLRSRLVLHQVTSKRISKFFRLYMQNKKLLRSLLGGTGVGWGRGENLLSD